MNRSSTVLIPLLTLMLTLGACERKSASVNGTGIWGPASYATITPSTGKPPAPGVEQGTMLMGYCHWSGRSVSAFAVWVGEDGGGSCSSFTEPQANSPAQRVAVFRGTVAKVPVECRTTDGKAGTIKIGEDTFQLEQGALFLVSNATGKPVIRQLPLTHLQLQPGAHPTLDGIRATASSDPVISEFWKDATPK